jgi:uncharacterized protein involved in exopolysaccharide biosynthesis
VTGTNLLTDGILSAGTAEGPQSPTLRDLLAVGFRQRRLIMHWFLGIFSIALLLALLLPKRYVAQMKILVRHERAESVVSAERESPVQWSTQVTEEELQSEAELIKSSDLLGRVVVACNLQNLAGSSFFGQGNDTEDQRIARAVPKLEKDLSVEPIKLTNLIGVTYQSTDPQLAAKVLNSLASLYLDKHLAMHRAPGEFEFFHQQAEQYRTALASAQEKLTAFTQQQGVINPALEADISVRKLAELEAESKSVRTTIAETRQRILTLESQLVSLPKRETTEVRTSDNPQLMQTLKSKLLELELKHTELLAKFEPTYRPVQQVEEQIAQTRASIDAAEKAPLRDETTDRDPTYEALRTELAKAKTELAAAQARDNAMSTMIHSYRAENQQLNRKEVIHADMLRTAKADEENYLLYLRKEEEARISDALDRQRFSNVVVAEPATVPLKPQSRGLLILVFGGFLAVIVSVVVALIADRWDPSFRTPHEVEAFLGAPVLAALPKGSE